jgi:hypothetical protein
MQKDAHSWSRVVLGAAAAAVLLSSPVIAPPEARPLCPHAAKPDLRGLVSRLRCVNMQLCLPPSLQVRPCAW